jgi:hypothetical protein
MPAKHEQDIVRALLGRLGRTYAAEASIRLADKPAPLYQLLVLATLLSARISGGIAVSAARELFTAGYRTPRAMREASWQDRVDALGRGHYKRYDERTATMLGDAAELVRRRWSDDLRKLHSAGGDDAGRLESLLTEFPGIGPSGAAIFLREVQDVWPGVAPYLDRKALDGARRLGLPTDPGALTALAGNRGQLPKLAAALIRVSLSRQAADDVAASARG